MKVSINPLQVFAANPTTGFKFGDATVFKWQIGDFANTHLLTTLGVVIFTLNKQFFASLRSNAFLESNKWNLLTDVRFGINSPSTCGLGTEIKHASANVVGVDGAFSDDHCNKVPRLKMMAYTQLRLYLKFLMRYRDTWFSRGLGYHFDLISIIDDKQLVLDVIPLRYTFHIPYQYLKCISTKRFAISRVSLNVAIESHNNVANPYDGKYTFNRFKVNNEFLGSTSNTNKYWLKYLDYISFNMIRRRNLLALWNNSCLSNGGSVSYMFLLSFGWDLFCRSG
jgi:hypothetical protein